MTQTPDNHTLLSVTEVAARTGMTAGHVRNLRTNASIVKYGPHPLFSLGFKVGTGSNSRLFWRKSDVDRFIESL